MKKVKRRNYDKVYKVERDDDGCASITIPLADIPPKMREQILRALEANGGFLDTPMKQNVDGSLDLDGNPANKLLKN